MTKLSSDWSIIKDAIYESQTKSCPPAKLEGLRSRTKCQPDLLLTQVKI